MLFLFKFSSCSAHCMNLLSHSWCSASSALTYSYCSALRKRLLHSSAMPLNYKFSSFNSLIFPYKKAVFILRRTLHSSSCARQWKRQDDDPDLNIDFENEMMWLKDKFTNPASQENADESPVKMQNETRQHQWLWNILPESGHQKPVMKYDYTNWVNQVLHPYRGNHIAKFRTGKSAPPLTADVAVELLTCELKDRYGYDRYAAYEVASYVRKPLGVTEQRGVPVAPGLTATDLAGSRKIVDDAMATMQAYTEEGISEEMIYRVPEMIRASADDVPRMLQMLRDSNLFPECAPLVVLTPSGLLRALLQCRSEEAVLGQFPTRFHFLAHVFQVDVGSIACHAANAGFHVFFTMDLTYWAVVADLCRFYRVHPDSIKARFKYLIKFRVSLVDRFDKLARLHNSPRVLAALAEEGLHRPSVVELLAKNSSVSDNLGRSLDGGVDKSSKNSPGKSSETALDKSSENSLGKSSGNSLEKSSKNCLDKSSQSDLDKSSGNSLGKPSVQSGIGDASRPGGLRRSNMLAKRLARVVKRYREEGARWLPQQETSELLKDYTPPDLAVACYQGTVYRRYLKRNKA